MKKKLYKSIFTLEVLSEEPISEYDELHNIIYECDTGMYSGFREDIVNIEIEGKDAVKEVEKHGTDLDFFQMDENGDHLEDNY